MQRDLRRTALYQEVESLILTLRQPGAGLVSDAAEVSTNGRQAAYAGTLVEALEGTPPTRICLADLATGDTRVLTFGPNVDRLPKFSPDGRQIAFLSDRRQPGDFQLYLLDPVSGAARSTSDAKGWVEYLHWSPDGTRILLGVAGRGADVSSAQGALSSKRLADDCPSWMPAVDSGDENYRWRRVWLYELATGRLHEVGDADDNVWEAAWCGNDAFAAVVSPGPMEGLWYSARLRVINIETGRGRDVHVPRSQIGWPAASASGKHLAIVEGVCSDRWVVAGDLLLIELASGNARQVDTNGTDITYTEWCSDRQLLLAGHRGFETVVGVYDADSGAFREAWSSEEVTAGGRYATVASLNAKGDCALVGEGFRRAPELAVIRGGEYAAVKSFDLGYTAHAKVLDSVERLRWRASDGLEIQGWLLRPAGAGPHPLIMNIHGGPIWHWRSAWLGRAGAVNLMLLKRGYAVFLPNPRGSTGRGQEFAQQVLGEMGGADTGDYLAGLDHLVGRGIADPSRLGVMGGSYGGFMTSWLITQGARFAAAVPVAPVTNWVSEHLISNIPHFVVLGLADRYVHPDGKYFRRSPVMFAHRASTPTLHICGALDRCTPPEEAVQFHNALLEHGVESVLVTYPEEGHGIRKFPAAIDCAARILAWFDVHLACRVAR